MKDLEIFDNFLEPDTFQPIYDLFMGNSFPWFFNESIHWEPENMQKRLDNFYFTHNFYDKFIPTSNLFPALEPLIAKINPLSLVRIKANLTPVTPTRQITIFHTDFEVLTAPLKTAVFYINTNNGATLFENGEEVESVENRLVVFDSNKKHAGSTCTDQQTRVLINLNFLLW